MHRALFEVNYIGSLQGFLNIIIVFIIFSCQKRKYGSSYEAHDCFHGSIYSFFS